MAASPFLLRVYNFLYPSGWPETYLCKCLINTCKCLHLLCLDMSNGIIDNHIELFNTTYNQPLWIHITGSAFYDKPHLMKEQASCTTTIGFIIISMLSLIINHAGCNLALNVYQKGFCTFKLSLYDRKILSYWLIEKNKREILSLCKLIEIDLHTVFKM